MSVKPALSSPCPQHLGSRAVRIGWGVLTLVWGRGSVITIMEWTWGGTSESLSVSPLPHSQPVVGAGSKGGGEGGAQSPAGGQVVRTRGRRWAASAPPARRRLRGGKGRRRRGWEGRQWAWGGKWGETREGERERSFLAGEWWGEKPALLSPRHLTQ